MENEILAIVIISWRYEILGGIAFILGGIIYILALVIASLKNSFQVYYIAWAFQISGIAFLIGILFLIGWNRKRKNQPHS